MELVLKINGYESENNKTLIQLMSSIVRIAKHETNVTTVLSYPPLDPLSSWEYHVKLYRYEYTRGSGGLLGQYVFASKVLRT